MPGILCNYTHRHAIFWISSSITILNEKIFPLQIVRFSKDAFTEGIYEHQIDGVKVRIYSAAKTVADCFKFRNKIGTDVAIEALRECLREKKATRDQLWHYSGICRVRNVMRPYLEAIS